jgi:dTDP-glucose 4,6-dehydratase
MQKKTAVGRKRQAKERGRLLLTGAGGAIGVHVLAYLMEHTDWNVVALDSFKAEHKGYFDRITTVCKGHPEWNRRIQVFSHDLTAPFSAREIERLGHVGYIVNLASRSDVQNSVEDPLPFVRNNTELMLNILDYARIVQPKAFLHFSTDEVYGPAPKESGGHKEWEAIVPSNPYSASKAMQEALAIAWWRCYGVPVIITNTMNNFGEMQAPSKFPAMIQSKIERGETIDVHSATNGEIGTRYYIHSRNVADAILFILQNVPPVMHAPGKIDRPVRLNIVGDRQMSNLDLVEHIGKLMGKKPKSRLVYFHEKNPGHDLHYGLNGAALAALGWKSPASFDESMKRTIAWQKRHTEWMK